MLTVLSTGATFQQPEYLSKLSSTECLSSCFQASVVGLSYWLEVKIVGQNNHANHPPIPRTIWWHTTDALTSSQSDNSSGCTVLPRRITPDAVGISGITPSINQSVSQNEAKLLMDCGNAADYQYYTDFEICQHVTGKPSGYDLKSPTGKHLDLFNKSNHKTQKHNLSVIINSLVNAHKSNPITQEGTWIQCWTRPVGATD